MNSRRISISTTSNDVAKEEQIFSETAIYNPYNSFNLLNEVTLNLNELVKSNKMLKQIVKKQSETIKLLQSTQLSKDDGNDCLEEELRKATIKNLALDCRLIIETAELKRTKNSIKIIDLHSEELKRNEQLGLMVPDMLLIAHKQNYEIDVTSAEFNDDEVFMPQVLKLLKHDLCGKLHSLGLDIINKK